PGDWGKLEFGRVRLAFEFVRPPKALVGRKRAMAMDGTMISTFVATAFCIASFYTVSQFMWNPAAQMETRKVDKRSIKVDVNLAQEKDEKKLEVGETQGDGGGDKAGENKFGSADDVDTQDDNKKVAKVEKRPESDAERSARLAKEVKGKTILQFLDGGPGGKTGPMTGITGMGNAFDMNANTMAVYTEGGAAGTGIAAGGGKRWGGAGGMAATPGGGIQKLAKSEVPGGGGRPGIVKVATDEKVEEAVKIRIGGSISGQSGSGKIDRASVESVFRRRKGAIQDCYERALKVNPNAAGKVTIRFTIGTGGTVTSIDVADNSTGDTGIGTCIVQKVRSWPFPASEEGDVTFVYPFVLTSGG
ncbi:MAG: TonB family protein, partial [Deltaproteobacteria bacterium]|nr:TonB family protein [Deltaproteobacteria bacterium]